ncbi:MAG TPA: methyltransferase domain-containing protein [Candidatus Binataceae bacterium]|nr:methyltransferase domain-containing protein [Candidatus Binataceae bacterium]
MELLIAGCQWNRFGLRGTLIVLIMPDSVQQLFDRTADTYDRARRKLIPCFDELYRAAIDALPFGRDDEIEVLDLGAGTGLLAAFVAYGYPRARITMVDGAEQMLVQARERFALGGDRFRFEIADYGEGRITGRYDAILSALSLNHLSDDKKRMIFEQSYAALNQGGLFVNADRVRAETPEREQRHHDSWIRRAREIGVGEHDLRQALERMKLDRAATVGQQLEWLSAAGFSEVGLAYRNLIFAVYSGIK